MVLFGNAYRFDVKAVIESEQQFAGPVLRYHFAFRLQAWIYEGRFQVRPQRFCDVGHVVEPVGLAQVDPP